jgi:hypothetical protein
LGPRGANPAHLVSNRAFRVDRPIQKLTKIQPTIAREQRFFSAHFKLIEDIS